MKRFFILAILEGSQLGIIPVKSEPKWLKNLGGDLKQIQIVLFFRSVGHFVHWSKTGLAVLIEGRLSNIPTEFE